MNYGSKDEGMVSKWNEGNLFSLRLHEAKEMINFSKINPLQISPDGQNWNYQNWIAGITVLFEEGYGKYKQNEIKEVQDVKNAIFIKLKFNSPHKIIYDQTMGGCVQRNVIHYENWEKLRMLIELYEQKVKKFNEIRGLSTANIDKQQGLFG